MTHTVGEPHHGGPTPPVGRTVTLKTGGSANFRPNGQVRSIDKPGMHIEHTMYGSRTIVSEHNNVRVVSVGANRGYVQRPYAMRNGHTYYQRTYVVNHVAYTRVYRSYYYGGHYYYGYYHPYYYHPAFYGWAYSPWPAPVYYGWGWGAAPWYGYYGWYFAPYPYYPGAAFWLTDYVLAANLQAAYEAQAAQAAAESPVVANPAPGNSYAGPGDSNIAGANANSVVLTPEVKQAIAEEVKAQLSAEQAASGQGASPSSGHVPSQNEVPPALDPARRTFVVASSLDVTSEGQECALSAGDVITRLTDKPDQDGKVTASVTASKKKDCAAGTQVAVSVDDLQEMHNHFQEQLDAGMKKLASVQGTEGIPTAPDTGTRPGEIPLPAADSMAAKALDDQRTQADQTDLEVQKEAAQASVGGGL